MPLTNPFQYWRSVPAKLLTPLPRLCCHSVESANNAAEKRQKPGRKAAENGRKAAEKRQKMAEKRQNTGGTMPHFRLVCGFSSEIHAY